jgi:hypothetical protein
MARFCRDAGVWCSPRTGADEKAPTAAIRKLTVHDAEFFPVRVVAQPVCIWHAPLRYYDTTPECQSIEGPQGWGGLWDVAASAIERRESTDIVEKVGN